MRRLLVGVLSLTLTVTLAAPAGAGPLDDLLGDDLLDDGLADGGLHAALTATTGEPAPVDLSQLSLFVNWAELTPAWPTGPTPTTTEPCPSGSTGCVDAVVEEMARRYGALGCDHDAVFALTYLLTTEGYREAVSDPRFFDDNAFVNNQDVVFADYYFRAFDDWHGGDTGEVPPAWRVAFDAARERDVTGLGNIFLGMNAHIRRDLPFVLDSIGLTAPDGTSRKRDHDRVNDILRSVQDEVLATAAERHDPAVDDVTLGGLALDEDLLIQVILTWREEAWRKAELLANAPTGQARAEVAGWIEREAAATAGLIRTLFSDPDPSTRDAHCRAWLDGGEPGSGGGLLGGRLG